MVRLAAINSANRPFRFGGLCFSYSRTVYFGALRWRRWRRLVSFTRIEILQGALRGQKRAGFCRIVEPAWPKSLASRSLAASAKSFAPAAPGLSALRARNDNGVSARAGIPLSLCQSIADDLARTITAAAPSPVIVHEPSRCFVNTLKKFVEPTTSRTIVRREQPLNSQVIG